MQTVKGPSACHHDNAKGGGDGLPVPERGRKGSCAHFHFVVGRIAEHLSFASILEGGAKALVVQENLSNFRSLQSIQSEFGPNPKGTILKTNY